jgi:hypothetical protein
MSALLLITAASASMWTGLHPDPSQTADGYQPGGMDAATHRREVQVIGCRCCCRCVLLHVCFVASSSCFCIGFTLEIELDIYGIQRVPTLGGRAAWCSGQLVRSVHCRRGLAQLDR